MVVKDISCLVSYKKIKTVYIKTKVIVEPPDNNMFTYARVGSSTGEQPSHIPPPKHVADGKRYAQWQYRGRASKS